MQAVILAGGKGSRLAERLNGLPKPLIVVGGKPLLQRQIEHLKSAGIKKILILVNHKKECIEEFIIENNSFELDIKLIDDGKPKGTGGALFSVLDHLDEKFLTVYGDTLFNININKFSQYHDSYIESNLTLLVHPNDHPEDSDLIKVDENNSVISFHSYPHSSNEYLPNIVNAAMYVINKNVMQKFQAQIISPCDLAKDVFPLMLAGGESIKVYNSPEYIKDIGSPSRLDKANDHIKTGLFDSQGCHVKQKAVFIDRDGTINYLNGHINSHQDLSLFPYAGKHIKSLQDAGYRTALITNQPVVARGEVSIEGYREIDAKLDTELSKYGAYFDAKFVCMHHPDSGFEGEVPNLKINCDCRKPKPGLIDRAVKDLNVDRQLSWMIGDTTADFGAAINANISVIGLRTGMASSDGLHDYQPDMTLDNLGQASLFIEMGYEILKDDLAEIIDLYIDSGQMMLVSGNSDLNDAIFTVIKKECAITGIQVKKRKLHDNLRPHKSFQDPTTRSANTRQIGHESDLGIKPLTEYELTMVSISSSQTDDYTFLRDNILQEMLTINHHHDDLKPDRDSVYFYFGDLEVSHTNVECALQFHTYLSSIN